MTRKMYDLIILPCTRCGVDAVIPIFSSYTQKCKVHRCKGAKRSSRILDPALCEGCNKRVDCLTNVEEIIQATSKRIARYELSFAFNGGVDHDLQDPTTLRLIGRQATYEAKLNGKIYFYYDTFVECEAAAKALHAAYKQVGFRAGMRRGWSVKRGPQKNVTDYFIWADKLSG